MMETAEIQQTYNNFEWYRGDTLAFDVNVIDYTDPNAPVPIDITGWTLYFTLNKDDAADGADEIVVSQTEHYDAVNGKSLLTSESTKDFLGYYRYDIRWKDTDGKIGTLSKGVIEFHRDSGRSIYA